jgi:hypothetical protein
MVTGVGGPSAGAGSVSGSPSGQSGAGKPSAVDTLAKEMGISPDELKKQLKAELEKAGGKGECKGGKSEGGNPSGEAGDVNGDGKVDEKDLEALAAQKLGQKDGAKTDGTGQPGQTSTAGIDGGSSAAAGASAPSGAIA